MLAGGQIRALWGGPVSTGARAPIGVAPTDPGLGFGRLLQGQGEDRHRRGRWRNGC